MRPADQGSAHAAAQGPKSRPGAALCKGPVYVHMIGGNTALIIESDQILVRSARGKLHSACPREGTTVRWWRTWYLGRRVFGVESGSLRIRAYLSPSALVEFEQRGWDVVPGRPAGGVLRWVSGR